MDFDVNYISDVSPLSVSAGTYYLTGLKAMTRNSITDVSPLSGQ